jgi:hypothetical protein
MTKPMGQNTTIQGPPLPNLNRQTKCKKCFDCPSMENTFVKPIFQTDQKAALQ